MCNTTTVYTGHWTVLSAFIFRWDSWGLWPHFVRSLSLQSSRLAGAELCCLFATNSVFWGRQVYQPALLVPGNITDQVRSCMKGRQVGVSVSVLDWNINTWQSQSGTRAWVLHWRNQTRNTRVTLSSSALDAENNCSTSVSLRIR